MMAWLTVLLISLATYRVTRLLVSDVIFEPPREKLANHLAKDGHHRLIYLLSCEWCVSMWVGAMMTLMASLVASVPLPLFTWMTASAITGFLASREDPCDAAEEPE